METYVAFMCTLIPDTTKVQLYRKQGGTYWDVKLGIAAFDTVEINILEKHTRSALISIKFDTYTKEFIFYLSRQKGPEPLLNELRNKIKTIVWKSYQEDDRDVEVSERHGAYTRDFFIKLKSRIPNEDSTINRTNIRPITPTSN